MANNNSGNRGPDNNKRLAFLERQMTRLRAHLDAVPGFALDNGEEAVDAALRLIDGSKFVDNVATPFDEVLLAHYAHYGAEECRLRTALDVRNDAPLADETNSVDAAIHLIGELDLELRDLRVQMIVAGHFLAGREGFTPDPAEGAVVALLRIVSDLDVKLAVEPDAAAQIASLTGELAAARASRAAQKGQATRARNEAAVLKAERSPVARAVVPMEEPRMRGAIETAVEAGEVEIVFSDGEREILELVPRRVLGDAWQRTGGRLMLRQGVELEPGDMDKPEVAVAGFGLFAGGEQIAWRALPEAVKVSRNGRVLLENAITF